MTKRRTSQRRTPPSRHLGWALVRLLVIYGTLALIVGLTIWTLYLNSVVREKFEGKKWSLPARVYARPLELYQGLSITPALLEQELKALGYRFENRLDVPGQIIKKASAGSDSIVYHIHSRGFAFWDTTEAARRFALTVGRDSVVALTDLSGNALDVIRLEPAEIGGFYPADKEDRLLVRLSDLPPLLGETLLAVEDKQFLDHHGVSPSAIARAAYVNFTRGGVVQGGSTITQQLVKNFYLTNEQSLLKRKIPEAIMAVLLEVHYTKAEILETYINEIFLGQAGNRGIHGFALGAQHYFRQPLNELEPQDLALLIGLVKGASYYNPWRHPERALERRNVVLGVMKAEGLIDEQTYQRGIAAPLNVLPQSDARVTTYPAFMDLIKRELRTDYAEDDLRSEGLRIFTTLSPMAQRIAEKSLQTRLGDIEKQRKTKDLQGAAIILSVGSGEVLAVVGDRNPRFDGLNRALDAKRQIGSLMKPFVYLTALEQPEHYHLGTIVSDDPVSYKSGGQWWAPKNADNRDHGNIPLYKALSNSYNQATARLGMTLGLDRVADTVVRAGASSVPPKLPAMLLGAVEMVPLDVATLYHTLAAEGVYSKPRAIRDVLTADGKPLKRYPLELETRFSPEASFQLRYALQHALREGTGRSAYSQLPRNTVLAGKTGTTNDQRDSWFAGFSSEHVAVVWVGRDDNSPMPLGGATGALPVWTDLMKQLPTQSLDDNPPLGVSFQWIDEATGWLSSERCAGSVYLPLQDNYLPANQVPCAQASTSPVRNFWQRLVN